MAKFDMTMVTTRSARALLPVAPEEVLPSSSSCWKSLERDMMFINFQICQKRGLGQLESVGWNEEQRVKGQRPSQPQKNGKDHPRPRPLPLFLLRCEQKIWEHEKKNEGATKKKIIPLPIVSRSTSPPHHLCFVSYASTLDTLPL